LGADSFEFTPAWAPFRGRLIFGLEGLDDNVYLRTIATNGRRMHQLRVGIEPDWSITNRIVFEDGKGIATMAPGGGHLHRLRAGGQPRWSPDGRWIVFERDLPRDRVGIAIMRADGSKPRILARGPWDRSPVWSPEGQHIAYVHRNRRKRREKIVVMRTNGRGRHAILAVRRRPGLADSDRVLEDLDWQPLPF
jgi:dipeptidyl aminopeptidase/acylaminoacyl peptidase